MEKLGLQYIIVKKMGKENKSWSQHEDEILRCLREDRGLKKWSSISRIMEEQFGIKGKSGKRCRQRYHIHVNSRVRKDGWTLEEENTLFLLHNQMGNKWTEIAKKLGRSDNTIKNHYHSKLRKALRKINKIIYDNLKYQFKPIKNNVLPKLIHTAEGYYNQINKQQSSIHRNCFVMKNKILNFLHEGQKVFNELELIELRLLVRELNHFNKIYKKKNKKAEEKVRRKRCYDYKGKEIICLINENNKKIVDSQQEGSLSISSLSSQEQINQKSIPSQSSIQSSNKIEQTNQSPIFNHQLLLPQQSLYFMMYQPLTYPPMMALPTINPQYCFTFMG